LAMRRRKLLGATGAGAVVLAIGAVLWHYRQLDDLPEPDRVTAMRLTVCSLNMAEPDDKVCNVSPEHFAPILAALRPHRRDRDGIPWVVIGSIDVTLREGGHCYIWLYSTQRGDEGALSVGSTPYRGGTDDGIKATIRSACP
jgi:hypothetical protein